MPVNGGIDNKMAGFFQTVVLKYNPKDKQKKKSLEPLEKEYSDLTEKLVVKIMSFSFLRSFFGLTQTKNSFNGKIKYKF